MFKGQAEDTETTRKEKEGIRIKVKKISNKNKPVLDMQQIDLACERRKDLFYCLCVL